MKKDYVSLNRDIWDNDAPNWVGTGERLWALADPEWGNWGVPNSTVQLLPNDMTGLDAVELGCGTGYVSSWMTKRGATVTGIDISSIQLETARHLAKDHALDITFLNRNAEDTGLPDQSFDFAISEYGASIWCKPDIWLKEAWRLLRPGGELVFLGNHPLSLICSPESGAPCDLTLHRPYRDMWGADWSEVEFEPSGICFNLAIGDWFTLFAEIGFKVSDYKELYAPDHAEGIRAAIPASWAKEYPIEQVWFLKRPA